MYGMIARFVGMNYVGVPLREDFGLDLTAMKSRNSAGGPCVGVSGPAKQPDGNVFDMGLPGRSSGGEWFGGD